MFTSINSDLEASALTNQLLMKLFHHAMGWPSDSANSLSKHRAVTNSIQWNKTEKIQTCMKIGNEKILSDL